jgi:hypothetical protein
VKLYEDLLTAGRAHCDEGVVSPGGIPGRSGNIREIRPEVDSTERASQVWIQARVDRDEAAARGLTPRLALMVRSQLSGGAPASQRLLSSV